MPVVPRYDQPTVETNTLPMAQFNAPQAKNFAIEEGQQAMAGMQKLGTVGALVANDMQNKANQLRVDEALNQAKEESFRLSYDKDAGFLNVRGKDAVEILEGLEAGVEVVVAANFLIDAESNLKAALKGLDTGEKPQ